jgi:hypothetical protein
VAGSRGRRAGLGDLSGATASPICRQQERLER